ncbi:hypothetical protein [Burkholderia cenocepacia]|nr:hypothetical protein [Burkholderia cenocepacia]MDN7624974.1 hypothetical protein [Burkholderia cenocepacia]
MHTTSFERREAMRLKSRLLQTRDWHPLGALVVLYLIASAIAPAFGI